MKAVRLYLWNEDFTEGCLTVRPITLWLDVENTIVGEPGICGPVKEWMTVRPPD